LIKRAKFINRNNTLRQEFYFADPETLIHLNQVYNSDFSGSPVWDLLCREQEMLENSFSVALRLMLGVPREIHRYLLEPLSGRSHIKTELIKRFLNFLRKIRKSEKKTLNYVLEQVSNDVRSITGKNLYHIKSRCGIEAWQNLSPRDSIVPFRRIPESQNWRINLANELIDFRNKKIDIDGFILDETNELLTWTCTTGPS